MEEPSLRWLKSRDYPDAASIRDFFTGEISEARALLGVADAVLRAHDIGEEAGGLDADTLAKARIGARWMLGDVALMLRRNDAALEAARPESCDEGERVRIALALAQTVGFVETRSDLLRRFLAEMRGPP